VTVASIGLAPSLGPVLAIPGGVRGPQGQVVSKQLHDQCAVLVTVFIEGIQLCDGVIKCLLGELTRLVWAV